MNDKYHCPKCMKVTSHRVKIYCGGQELTCSKCGNRIVFGLKKDVRR